MRIIIYLVTIFSVYLLATACGFKAAGSSTDGIYNDTLTYRYRDYYIIDDNDVYSTLNNSPSMGKQFSQSEDAHYYKKIFKAKSEKYKNMIADTSRVFMNKFNSITKKQAYRFSSKSSTRHFNNPSFRYAPRWSSYRYGRPYSYYNGYPNYWSYDYFNPYYNNWGPYSYGNYFYPFWYNNLYLSPFFYYPYFSYGGYYNTSNNNTSSYSVTPYVKNGKVYKTKYNVGRKMSSPSLPNPSNYNREKNQFNQNNSYPSRNNNYGGHFNNNSQSLSKSRVRSSR